MRIEMALNVILNNLLENSTTQLNKLRGIKVLVAWDTWKAAILEIVVGTIL